MNKRDVVVAGCAAAIAALVSSSVFAQVKKEAAYYGPKWEVKCVPSEGTLEDLATVGTAQGRDGWELVQVLPSGHGVCFRRGL